MIIDNLYMLYFYDNKHKNIYNSIKKTVALVTVFFYLKTYAIIE